MRLKADLGDAPMPVKLGLRGSLFYVVFESIAPTADFLGRNWNKIMRPPIKEPWEHETSHVATSPGPGWHGGIVIFATQSSDHGFDVETRRFGKLSVNEQAGKLNVKLPVLGALRQLGRTIWNVVDVYRSASLMQWRMSWTVVKG